MTARKFITFLSDFGWVDDFVGTCHGVIKKIAPEVEIIDITHEVPRHGITHGAVVLENVLPYIPESVILAVVDPGVGGQRKPVAIRTAHGVHLVGPDNGLLSLAAKRLGGAEAAVELSCSAYALPHVCKTFEGRDLFSPVAAHLALGVELNKLGSATPVEELARIELPLPVKNENSLVATVINVDQFGNVQLNLNLDDLNGLGASLGDKLGISHEEESWKVPLVETFADVETEEILIYEDSYGKISFSVNQGSAGQVFEIAEGDEMRFEII